MLNTGVSLRSNRFRFAPTPATNDLEVMNAVYNPSVIELIMLM